MEPISGAKIFESVQGNKSILLACNTRVGIGVVEGIFQAAKDMNSAIIFELAASECNQNKGYTGHTPTSFAKMIKEAAEIVDWPFFSIHADHTTVKKDTPEDIKYAKDLLKEAINAGYTSFAIDASFLFDIDGKTTEAQLQKNADITVELATFIEDNIGNKSFGLECEVGEIGKTDESGMVITTVDEAKTYISMLNRNDVHPHALAIANGSTHGFRYDEHGNPIEQVTIDIPLTIDIARSIAPVGVAQHGITGTPLHLIASKFPHGDIIKGNVGTLWMNVAWDILQVYQPDLFNEIYEWTLNKYKKPGDKTPDRQIFQVNSKNAIKPLFDKIYSVEDDTRLALKARAYYEALMFLRAFKCRNTADLIKKKR